METWILILWFAMDRGGNVTTTEFTSKERCEIAGEAAFKATKYRNFPHLPNGGGNFVCVQK